MYSSISKLLDILFHRINPEKPLSWVLHPEYGTFDAKLQTWFMDVAETSLRGYSEDEQVLFLQRISETCSKYDRPKGAQLPWHLLVEYGERVLVYPHGEPLCRFEKVLDWRETYLQLGQDLIITAWLSYLRLHQHLNIGNYSWLPVIQSDNTVLETLLGSGIAENHYHLNGSADVFPITWSCIMTYPTDIEGNDWIDNYLQPLLSRGKQSNVWNGKRRLIYAAYIRLLLFKRLHSRSQDVIQAFRAFDRSYGFIGAGFVDSEIASWRELYCPHFLQSDGFSHHCLDYALLGCHDVDEKEPYRLLCGERKFLIDCFERCYTGDFDEETQILFYAYILIKSQFRTELIQENKQIGFSNFSNYEKRKKSLWKKRRYYYDEAYLTALVGPLNQTQVSTIEARICPDDTILEMVQNIHKVDQSVLFAKTRFASDWAITPYMINRARDFPYYFVWHFPKHVDNKLCNENISMLQCRHHELRLKYKRQSIAFVGALGSYPYFLERTRGIDACNNEIPCRPEVFANIFRFIRSHEPTGCMLNLSKRQPYISASFHAGEDFLDISDGLRAIDEAILFLNLHRGDRIGHGLALGVDPETHYEVKSHTLILPKQDCLDNLMWICFRSADLNVTIPPALQSKLYSRAIDLLHDIYGAATKTDQWGNSLSLRDYYLSWFLRGDAPEFYQTGCFKYDGLCDPFDRYGVNYSTQVEHLQSYRNNPIFSRLYYYYHYSASVKITGRQTTVFEVTADYIALMRQLQFAMQRRVNDLGISIECNPSSNVLIGTFNSYNMHPIFRFNSSGLTNFSDNVGMHVSVNTDDRGVFDTSLPFEYILIASTLAQQRDENNHRIHSDREIEAYLRNLQRMGQEQVFPGPSL